MAKHKKNKKFKTKQQPVASAQPHAASKKPRSLQNNSIFNTSWKFNAVIFFLLVLATVVLYSGDLRIGFFDTDDAGYVTENPFIKLNFENLKRIFADTYFANYSPIQLLTYMVDHAIAGFDPYFFHLANNIWAGIVAGLAFLVAQALTSNRFIAIASAVLFIVHPVHVEAIAWISNRKDLIAAAFVLPSFLAFIKYRKTTSNKTIWYGLSLVLFILALGGKSSVATFPAVFFAYDLFIEKRSVLRSLIDKIPFLAAAGLFALAVSSAQPPTGNNIEPYMLSSVLGQNLWLLTGFGTYVIYRIPPEGSGALLQLLGAIILLAVFLLPLLLRRRFPLITLMIYWMLFTFIPAQVLSFIHPVSDRYLFLPSVASCILIAVLIFNAVRKIGKRSLIVFTAIIVILTFAWTYITLGYLGEWKDPRSVWYGATKKSSDPQVYSGLGIHYQNVADRIGASPRGEPLPKEKAIALAKKVWKDNPRLNELLADWNAGKQNGEAEVAFKKYLHQQAWEAFDKAIKNKKITMTNIYFRRGLIRFDEGNFEEAKKEFQITLKEASVDAFAESREEFFVRTYNALGVIAWHERDFIEAMRLLKMARDRQINNNRNWVPELEGNIKRLEGIMGAQPQ